MTRALPPEQVLQSIINDPNTQRLQESIPRLAEAFAQGRRGQERQARLIDLSRIASDYNNPQAQNQALVEMATINPQATQAFSQGLQQQQDRLEDLRTAKIEKAKNDLIFTASSAIAIKNAKTDKQKNSIYQRFLADAEARGLELDPKTTPQNYYSGMEEEYINPIIDQAESMGLVDRQEPLSPEGKRAFDIEEGFLKAGTKDPKGVEATFKKTTNLRKEFTKESKSFIVQRAAYNRILASAEKSKLSNAPRGAGDLGLVYNYMKILDPNSTVRESEAASVQQSGSLPQVLIAMYNKLVEGGRLSDEMRADFVERSTILFNKALVVQKERVQQYTGIAQRNNLSVKDSILDFIGDPDVNAKALADILEEQAEQLETTTQQPTAQQQPTTQKIRRYNPETNKIE